MRLQFYTAVVLASSASPALSQSTQTSILGLTFGEPIPFSECLPGPSAEKWLKNPRKYRYESPYILMTSTPCYEREQPFQKTPIGDETLTIKYPMSIKLALTQKRYFTATTIGGRLSGIYLYHGGISLQAENLRALEAKFGKPTGTEDTVWRNAFGVGYTATDAIWNLPGGLMAIYISRSKGSDEIGQFQMFTKEQHERSEAASGKPDVVDQGL